MFECGTTVPASTPAPPPLDSIRKQGVQSTRTASPLAAPSLRGRPHPEKARVAPFNHYFRVLSHRHAGLHHKPPLVPVDKQEHRHALGTPGTQVESASDRTPSTVQSTSSTRACRVVETTDSGVATPRAMARTPTPAAGRRRESPS